MRFGWGTGSWGRKTPIRAGRKFEFQPSATLRPVLEGLSVRSVVCLSCGAHHDRDENAAKNIEMVGMGHRHDLKRAGRDGKTTLVVRPDELPRIAARARTVSMSNC